MSRIIIERNNKHVLLAEGNGTGHRLYYIRLLAEAALARGDRVTVALTEYASNTAEMSLHLGHLVGRFKLMIIPICSIAEVALVSHEVHADITVIPDGDLVVRQLLTRWAWGGSGKLSLLMMREKSQTKSMPGQVTLINLIKKMIFIRGNLVSGVNVVVLKSAIWKGRSLLAVALDPITLVNTSESEVHLRENWGLDSETFWFGVLGAIHERKNLPLVARALKNLAVPSIGLLIAGDCAPAALKAARFDLDELTDSGVRVIIVDRLLSDRELDSSVAVVDAVVLAHSNEGPSGLFGKAVTAGTRVVAAGARSLRHDAQAAPTLAVWTSLTVEGLNSAFAQVLVNRLNVIPKETDHRQFANVLLEYRVKL